MVSLDWGCAIQVLKVLVECFVLFQAPCCICNMTFAIMQWLSVLVYLFDVKLSACNWWQWLVGFQCPVTSHSREICYSKKQTLWHFYGPSLLNFAYLLSRALFTVWWLYYLILSPVFKLLPENILQSLLWKNATKQKPCSTRFILYWLDVNLKSEYNKSESTSSVLICLSLNLLFEMLKCFTNYGPF